MNAASLLSEIEAYLARNNIRPSTFGDHAINDKSLVLRLQNGVQVKPKTAAKCRRFMAENPSGGIVPKASRKKYVARVGLELQRDPIAQFPSPVDRDPCFWCGTRQDLGCKHYPLEART